MRTSVTRRETLGLLLGGTFFAGCGGGSNSQSDYRLAYSFGEGVSSLAVTQTGDVYSLVYDAEQLHLQNISRFADFGRANEGKPIQTFSPAEGEPTEPVQFGIRYLDWRIKVSPVTGNVYHGLNGIMSVLSPSGEPLFHFGLHGRTDRTAISGTDFAFLSNNDVVIATVDDSYQTTRIVCYDSEGNRLSDFSILEAGLYPLYDQNYKTAYSIAVDANDTIYLDTYGSTYKCAANGRFLGLFPPDGRREARLQFRGFVVDNRGMIHSWPVYKGDQVAETLEVYTPEGNLLRQWKPPGELETIDGINSAVDASGRFYFSSRRRENQWQGPRHVYVFEPIRGA